jgi:hypothetical protein
MFLASGKPFQPLPMACRKTTFFRHRHSYLIQTIGKRQSFVFRKTKAARFSLCPLMRTGRAFH